MTIAQEKEIKDLKGELKVVNKRIENQRRAIFTLENDYEKLDKVIESWERRNNFCQEQLYGQNENISRTLYALSDLAGTVKLEATIRNRRQTRHFYRSDSVPSAVQERMEVHAEGVDSEETPIKGKEELNEVASAQEELDKPQAKEV